MRIIVALGNPGKEYENTRHNLGFSILDRFSALKGCHPFELVLGSQVSLNNHLGKHKYVLCKPYEFMNNSGKTFLKIFKTFNWRIQDVLLIYDELDVALGRFKLTKRKENQISHRGVRDVDMQFPKDNILKMKVGIRPPLSTNLVIRDFVMEKFLPEELSTIESIEKDIFKVIERFISLDENQLSNPINYLSQK